LIQQLPQTAIVDLKLDIGTARRYQMRCISETNGTSQAFVLNLKQLSVFERLSGALDRILWINFIVHQGKKECRQLSLDHFPSHSSQQLSDGMLWNSCTRTQCLLQGVGCFTNIPFILSILYYTGTRQWIECTKHAELATILCTHS